MPLYGKIVIIKRNGQDGTTFPLMAQLCLFGRSTTCDIRVQLPNISKEHCAIIVGEDGAVSVNAYDRTLINGIPVNGRADIAHKDIMTISDRSFRFEYPPNSDHRKTLISTPMRTTSSYLLGPSLETPIDEATPGPPASAGRTPRPKLVAGSAKRKSAGASPHLTVKTPNAKLKRASTSPKLTTLTTSPKKNKIIKSPKSSALKKYQSRKNVSFGPYLSPEQFDLNLPANTPIRKGTTPRRISEPPKYFGSPIVLSKFPAQNRNQFSVAATIPEEPNTPDKNTPSRKNASPRLSTSFFTIKYLSPKKRTPSKAKSPSPKKKTTSPKAKSPSPKKNNTSSKAKSASPKKNTTSPKAKSPSPKKNTTSLKAKSSSKKEITSPKAKSLSPKKKSTSPKAKSPSPKKKTTSPKAKSPSPKKKTTSPKAKSPSPKKRSTFPQGKSSSPKLNSPTKIKTPLKTKSTLKLPSPAKILYSKNNYPDQSSPLQQQHSSFLKSSPNDSDVLYLSSSDTSLVGSVASLQKRLSQSPVKSPKRISVSAKTSTEKPFTPRRRSQSVKVATSRNATPKSATVALPKTLKIPTPVSPDSKKIKALAAIHASKLKKTPKSVKKTPKLKVSSVKKGINNNLFSEVLKKGLAKRTPKVAKRLVSLNVARKKAVVKKTPGRKPQVLKSHTNHANSPETVIISKKKIRSARKSSVGSKSYNISSIASPSDITTDVFVSPLESSIKSKGRSKGIMMARFMNQQDKKPRERLRKSGKGYLDPSGIKQLLKSPQKTLKADYSNVSGIKQLFAKNSSDYSDVGGVKELLKTPSNNQISTYERVKGVKALLYRAKDTGTPKVKTSGIRKSSVTDLLSLPNTSLGDLEIAQLFGSPEKSLSPTKIQTPPKHFSSSNRRKSGNIGINVVRPVGIATQIRNSPLSSLSKTKDETSAINRSGAQSPNSTLSTQKHDGEKRQSNTTTPRMSVRKHKSLSPSKLYEMFNLPSPNKSIRKLRSISPRKSLGRTRSLGTSTISKNIHAESKKVLDDVVSQVTSIVSPRGRPPKLPQSLTKHQSPKLSYGMQAKSPKQNGDKNLNSKKSPRISQTNTEGDSTIIITQNSDPHELLETAKASTPGKLVVLYLVSPERLQSNSIFDETTPKSSKKSSSPRLNSTSKEGFHSKLSPANQDFTLDKTIPNKKDRKTKLSHLKEETSTPFEKEKVAFPSSISPVSKERSSPKRKRETNDFSSPERSASKSRSPSPKKTRRAALSKSKTPTPTKTTTQRGKGRKSLEPSPTSRKQLKSPSPIKKTRGRKKILINESKADDSVISKQETPQVKSPTVKRGRPRKTVNESKADDSVISKQETPPVKRGRGRARKTVNESKSDDSVISKQETSRVKSPTVKRGRLRKTVNESKADDSVISKQETPTVKRGQGRTRKTVNESKVDESSTSKQETAELTSAPVRRGQGRARKNVVSPAKSPSISKEQSNLDSESKSPSHGKKEKKIISPKLKTSSHIRSARGKRAVKESLNITTSPVRSHITSPKKTLSPSKPKRGRPGTAANQSVEIYHPESIPSSFSPKQHSEAAIASPKKATSPKKSLRVRKGASGKKMSSEKEKINPKYQSPAREGLSPTTNKPGRRGGKAISSPKEQHPTKRVTFSPKKKSPIAKRATRGKKVSKATNFQEEDEKITKMSPKTSPSPTKKGERQVTLTKTPSPSPKKTRSRRGVTKVVETTSVKSPSPIKRKRATTSKIVRGSAKKGKTGKGLSSETKTDDDSEESSDVLDQLRQIKVKKNVKKKVMKKKPKKNTKLSIIAEISDSDLSVDVKTSSPVKMSPPKRNLRASRRIKK